MLIDHAIEDFLLDQRSRGNSIATLEYYVAALRNFREYSLGMQDFSPLDRLEKEKKPTV